MSQPPLLDRSISGDALALQASTTNGPSNSRGEPSQRHLLMTVPRRAVDDYLGVRERQVCDGDCAVATWGVHSSRCPRSGLTAEHIEDVSVGEGEVGPLQVVSGAQEPPLTLVGSVGSLASTIPLAQVTSMQPLGRTSGAIVASPPPRRTSVAEYAKGAVRKLSGYLPRKWRKDSANSAAEVEDGSSPSLLREDIPISASPDALAHHETHMQLCRTLTAMQSRGEFSTARRERTFSQACGNNTTAKAQKLASRDWAETVEAERRQRDDVFRRQIEDEAKRVRRERQREQRRNGWYGGGTASSVEEKERLVGDEEEENGDVEMRWDARSELSNESIGIAPDSSWSPYG